VAGGAFFYGREKKNESEEKAVKDQEDQDNSQAQS